MNDLHAYERGKLNLGARHFASIKVSSNIGVTSHEINHHIGPLFPEQTKIEANMKYFGLSGQNYYVIQVHFWFSGSNWTNWQKLG